MAKKSEQQTKENQTVEQEVCDCKCEKDTSGKKKKQKDSASDDTIQKLEEENALLKETAQRIQAEFDNYRRRSLADSEQREIKAVASTIKVVIPALDSMDEAIRVYSADETKAELKEGIEKIRKQLSDSLLGIGVSEMVCEKKDFDPNMHEAVMMQEQEGEKSGVILSVFRKGYTFKDAVIRHAQVIVAK